jgi:hypothetical protein
MLDLKLVFHISQKGVGTGERRKIFIGDQLFITKPMKSPKGIPFPNPTDLSSIDELQGLDEKFYFTNSPPVELDVDPAGRFLAKLLQDLPFHLPDFINGSIIKIFSIDKGTEDMDQFVSQREISGNGPTFNQGCPFPGLAKGFIIKLIAPQR